MTTTDTIEGNQFETDMSDKNESSDSTEELKKSFTSLTDKSKITSLNDTCEVNILTLGKLLFVLLFIFIIKNCSF
jgi:hypothetical protein